MNRERPTPEELVAEARQELVAILSNFRTVILGTTDASGEPNASYAPAAIDEQRDFYIYVSSLAKHDGCLKATGKASLMIIEDECTSATLFARKRLTLPVSAEFISRGTDEWESKFALLESKFSPMIGQLKKMSDFSLFRLRPSEGLLVYGFGRAFRVLGDRLEKLDFVQPDSGGHSQVSLEEVNTSGS